MSLHWLNVGCMQVCNTQPCDEFLWTAGPWGVCDKPCISTYDAAAPKRYRSVTCVRAATGERVPDSNCTQLSAAKFASEEACNTRLCSADELATWTITGRGPCTPTYCGGTYEQSAECR